MLAARTSPTGRYDNAELTPALADAIDDRIAEILDELLDERIAMRPRRRLRRVLVVFLVVLTLITSALLRPATVAAWAVWTTIASTCLAASCALGGRWDPS